MQHKLYAISAVLVKIYDLEVRRLTMNLLSQGGNKPLVSRAVQRSLAMVSLMGFHI